MDISRKTNLVLHVISLSLILILVRVWYLSVVQHDIHVEQAKKPQRRVVIESAHRAPIYDRFGIPLAVNQTQYNAAICYANIRQIPTVIWEKDEHGNKVRIAARSNYIEKLSQMLSGELGIDVGTIEDTIHGKAAILPHTPFVLKENISEEQYYRLKMLEKDWVGIQAQRASKRVYPMGKVGCDVIGYLGQMDSVQYYKIARELQTLEHYLIAKEQHENRFLPEGFTTPDAVMERFLELQEKAYTMNDLIGKSGIEAFYEEDLRGYFGKKIYEIDTKGNRLRELEGSRQPLAGKKVTLTLSAELQDFAEKLLASIEGPQEERGRLDENWIRGGSVVAMIPKTGEVVALASYPRFNPNDFIPSRDASIKREKEVAVNRWLENERLIGAIWDGRSQIEREYFSFVRGEYIPESLPLTWDRYLQTILPDKSLVQQLMLQIETVGMAVQLQKYGIYHPMLKEIKSESDRLLILDLCHLIAPFELLTDDLIASLGHLPLAEYHADRQEAMRYLATIKEVVQELFHTWDFHDWREANFKDYMKERRQEEKARKKYAKPYTEYLEKVEKKMFSAFWDAYKSLFLYVTLTGTTPNLSENSQHLDRYLSFLRNHRVSTSDGAIQKKLLQLPSTDGFHYLSSFRSYDELNHPLQTQYPNVRFAQGKQLERHLAAAFYPLYGYGFSRSISYRQISPQGSVFKLITGYQMMLEQYQQKKPLNPLTIIDDLRGNPFSNSPTQVLGHLMDGTTLYRSYKGGRLPRSSHGGIGQVDFIGALERSSNIYFALAASDYIKDPLNLSRAAKAFCLGEKTGIDLPSEAKGNVPDDLDQNRTGLYSFSIGQHALDVTPLQTAAMMCAIANQGAVVQPHLLREMEGAHRAVHHEIDKAVAFPEEISSKTVVDQESHYLYKAPTKIVKNLPFPDEVFSLLKQGMQQVVTGARGTARPALMRAWYDHPSAQRDYTEIHRDLLAKTGTAQIRYKQTVSKTAPASMKHNIWFATIAYDKESHLTDPELVVVVFLRFRQSGREGGTIAAQVVKKWREISRSHQDGLEMR